MNRTHRERILDYLWSIAPDYATNRQIQKATGISSHQQVYLLTRELRHSHRIRAEQRGREWVFWADESPAVQLASPRWASRQRVAAEAGERLSPPAFEELARKVMSQRFGVPLAAGEAPGVPKEFDMVSPEGDVVGDAKYFTLVRGQRPPLAKFSVVAEHVWLLEKCAATTKFLVFGNDRQVPDLWLKRYGHLVTGVEFFFLKDDGALELLT
jgi:hypothetical protein